MKTKTRKKRKLKKGIKKGLLFILLITLLVIVINNYNKAIEREHKKDLQNYYTCIQEQSKNQGYIIRSACSPFYSQYDKELSLNYKKINFDLFLENN